MGTLQEHAIADSAPLTDHLIAVFRTQAEAEEALRFLQDTGHKVECLSIIGRDCVTEGRPIGFVQTDGRVRPLGNLGMFWRSTWGLPTGSAVMFVPGLGFVCFGGWLVAPVERAVTGGALDVIEGALAIVGIPTKRADQYKEALKAGRFLVLVHGIKSEIHRAKSTLSETQATGIECFSTRPAPSTGALSQAGRLL